MSTATLTAPVESETFEPSATQRELIALTVAAFMSVDNPVIVAAPYYDLFGGKTFMCGAGAVAKTLGYYRRDLHFNTHPVRFIANQLELDHDHISAFESGFMYAVETDKGYNDDRELYYQDDECQGWFTTGQQAYQAVKALPETTLEDRYR